MDGNQRRVSTQGWMNITRHETVLQMLSRRSQRFHQRTKENIGTGDNNYIWAVDETGTTETSAFTCEKDIIQREISEIRNITIPDEVLQVHGYAPPKKVDGTVRLIYENVNGFNN